MGQALNGKLWARAKDDPFQQRGRSVPGMIDAQPPPGPGSFPYKKAPQTRRRAENRFFPERENLPERRKIIY